MNKLEMQLNITPVFDCDEVPKVSVINVKPGDVIVVSSERALNSETHGKIAEWLQKFFGSEQKVIVVDGGLKLSVMRPDGEQQPAQGE
jgi:hypothetical protein